MKKTSLKDYYCYGYGFEPGKYANPSTHTAAVVVTKAKTKKKLSHIVSSKLDEINAMDLAEATGPYLGQLNMITVSSFIGPHGKLLGYEILENPTIHDKELYKIDHTQVYSADPLVEASYKLFGTRDEQHFPLIPGAHTPCAAKSIEKLGPYYLYGGVGLGITQDRDRNAIMIMEDIGYEKEITEKMAIYEEDKMNRNISLSMLEIAKNQGLKLKEIFVSTTRLHVHEDEVGCVLVAVPYITLATKALDLGKKSINNLDLYSWEKKIKKNFICNQ